MRFKLRQRARRPWSGTTQSGPRHGSEVKAVFFLERSCPETSMAPVSAIVDGGKAAKLGFRIVEAPRTQNPAVSGEK